MLEELHVHNYAIIDKLQVRFTEGLNVLSGETGAGKSILVGALGLLLGDRTDTSIIRSGAEETSVSGIVSLAGNGEAVQWLAGRGIEPEDGAVIVRRSLKSNGRGSLFIQSSPVTRADLHDFSSLLFDLHGQHEHQSLLDLENHRRLVDRWAGTEELAERFHSLYAELVSLRERLSSLVGDERERLRRIDLLTYAVNEIKSLAPRVGEEEELEKELAILVHHEKLFTLLEEAHTAVAESAGGVLAPLRRTRHAMEEILGIDPSLSKLSHQLEDAFYEIEDFAENIRQYKSRTDFSPSRLDEVQSRLSALRLLEKKYGDTVEKVLEYCRAGEQELSGMENYEEEKKSIEAEIARTEKEIAGVARELSDKRKAGGLDLQKRIESELRVLGMPKVSFRVLIQDAARADGTPVLTQWGKDAIEFVISPNLGEPFKKLRAIASGGELSRVMLAIKGVLAESDHVSSLVFDEVDAGIGGEVALAVGERLAALSRHKQVLCITHLATIAVRADNHLKIEKIAQSGRTVTRVEKVTGAARREEIARMLAGDRKGELSLQHAGELLAKYGPRKDEAR
ncbi:MAG TPA: DNA repair protein RecN [Spirochaetia bacterium]|nr:DNA repair protein RecN [Spirochaetia bacterium]